MTTQTILNTLGFESPEHVAAIAAKCSGTATKEQLQLIAAIELKDMCSDKSIRNHIRFKNDAAGLGKYVYSSGNMTRPVGSGYDQYSEDYDGHFYYGSSNLRAIN